ncbi:MAG TPA: hypothetical protein VG167_07775 [Verrucomicrobiae bacterium]|nr:hypothetical protein [Verrucomicrobiae bacterium]
METLLLEHNIISLRTAVVLDDGDLVYFMLMPKWLDPTVPGVADYGKSDATWLYRRKRSFTREVKLMRSFSPVERDVRPIVLKRPPELKLLWTEDGENAALFLNLVPWAFIHRDRRHGYSKGILRPSIGNPWDQKLFEQTFNRDQLK